MTQEQPIEALLLSADFFYKQKKYQWAAEIYMQILQKELQNGSALKGLGSCLYNLQKYEEALRCFQALEKIQVSDSVTAWIYATLISLGETKQAKELSKQSSGMEERLRQEGIALDYY